MLPAIGSVSAFAGQGRVGVVVGARPVGEPQDGQQLVALRIKTTETAASCEDCGPSLATYGPNGGLATPPSAAMARDAVSGVAGSEVNNSPAPAVARLPSELSAAEKAELTRLQQRDQQVRQEEKAHAAIAGDLGGPISYVYQLGPDGRAYAVGGSVGINAGVGSGDPAKAREIGARLAAAAVVPTNPSAQDYATARAAYTYAGQARRAATIDTIS